MKKQITTTQKEYNQIKDLVKSGMNLFDAIDSVIDACKVNPNYVINSIGGSNDGSKDGYVITFSEEKKEDYSFLF